MLLTVGDLVEDILIQLLSEPRRGADTSVRSARLRGGSGANVAALVAESGGAVRFVGQTGDDTIGHVLAEDLRDRGVDTRVRHLGGTGVTVTTAGQGSRSRLVDRGASSRVTLIDDDVLDDVSRVYLPASVFAADPLASAMDSVLGVIRDRRLPLTLGAPGSADLEEIGGPAFLELVRTLEPDAVVVNRAEHAALGCTPREPLDGARLTVVTAGPRPTLVLSGSRDESVPVAPVSTIRDRTGVGDGFIAGFMMSRMTGADGVAASHAGHRVAARVLGELGPTTGRRP